MHIIINNSSMVPIYEQIIDQIKSAIIRGELQPDTVLPSVRSLSKELKISALTVKKAYDNLEEEGFTVTVHGKGTYVAATNKNVMREEQLKEVEHDLEQAVMKGDGFVECSNSFGETTKYVNMSDLKRGHFQNSFGEMKVYLDQAHMAGDSVTIEVSNSFGQLTLFIPKEWNVVQKVSVLNQTY